MNVVFLSPHFPPNWRLFCVRLRNLGANVLGIADEPYELLHPDLRAALTEYYRVSDLHNYDEVLRALGYFTHRYGKIQRIDSLNEYWLETEAHLRTDFNIEGPKIADLPRMKRKSEMKRLFTRAQVDVARGILVDSPAHARAFVASVGYPVVAKPDIGVGANHTFQNRQRRRTRGVSDEQAGGVSARRVCPWRHSDVRRTDGSVWRTGLLHVDAV